MDAVCLSAIGVTRFFMSLKRTLAERFSLVGQRSSAHPKHLNVAWTNRHGEIKIAPRGKLAVTHNRPFNDQTWNAGLRRLWPTSTSGRAG